MKSRLPTILLACILALPLAPTPAQAKPTAKYILAHHDLYYSVGPSGVVSGPKHIEITVSRTDKPAGLLQSCGKIQSTRIESDTAIIDRPNRPYTIYGEAFLKKARCSFTQKMQFTPFTDAQIKAACIGVGPHTLTRSFHFDFWAWDNMANVRLYFQPANLRFIVNAHVQCPVQSAASPSTGSAGKGTPTGIRQISACNLNGSWPVWETAPGRRAAIPFMLTANQGRSDIYQVGTPNQAGVTGTAVVNGYNVSISLQGDNGTQTQSFSGSFDRSCSTLTGQTVHSNAPASLTVKRGGGYTMQSVPSSSAEPPHAKTRPRPTFGMPHVNTRVAPKWNTQLR